MHVSVSSETTCQPSHSLSDYGLITVGDSYHIVIDYNLTDLVVEVSDGIRPNWTQRWEREGALEVIGEEAMVWWMSGKFGSSSYNRGNGTFSNVVLTSNIDIPTMASTPGPTSSAPTLSPSNSPSNAPTASPDVSTTLRPSSEPTAEPVRCVVLLEIHFDCNALYTLYRIPFDVFAGNRQWNHFWSHRQALRPRPVQRVRHHH